MSTPICRQSVGTTSRRCTIATVRKLETRPVKAAALATAIVCWMFAAGTAAEPLLLLEAKIPLGKVSGRIDHLAIDLDRKRLFVAELGNNSVGIIDLQRGQVVRRLVGFREPQGVSFFSGNDTLYVANAGDGSVQFFQGEALTPAGRLELHDDADNVRVDEEGHRVIVGYGSGGLAVVDPSDHAKVADISLMAHPESFQIDKASNRIFANVPDKSEIAVVDIASGRQVAAWPVGEARANSQWQLMPRRAK
jgi:DNA-binding beta-propeller fold protein YncE